MPKDSAAYTPAALNACLNTLGTLVKATGAQYDARLVVVGGLVPRLLMNAQALDPLFVGEAHIGTSDVDLCIELDVPSGDDDFYEWLETTLQRYKFERVQRRNVRSRWSWARQVDGVTVVVDLLCNADDVGVGQPGRVAVDQPSVDSTDASGCVGYADFSMNLAGDTSTEARVRYRRYAKGAVDEFLRSWE